MPYAILSAIGTDRPGLVDEVSQFIYQHGGNIEDSRMVNLRGQFAMMVLIGGGEETLTGLGRHLAELAGRTQLHAELRPAAGARGEASAQAIPYRLSITAMDQAGLVHRVSHLLRGMGINIESLDTHLMPAPITGAPIFDMEMAISVPRTAPISRLRQGLSTLCDELNIDWQLAAM